jgi:hypothetical protein
MEDEDYFQFGDDINLAAGEALKVGGIKVVGAQGAAIADIGDTSGAGQDGTVRVKVNAILAALRAHGLIAT